MVSEPASLADWGWQLVDLDDFDHSPVVRPLSEPLALGTLYHHHGSPFLHAFMSLGSGYRTSWGGEHKMACVRLPVMHPIGAQYTNLEADDICLLTRKERS